MAQERSKTYWPDWSDLASVIGFAHKIHSRGQFFVVIRHLRDGKFTYSITSDPIRHWFERVEPRVVYTSSIGYVLLNGERI